MTIGFNFLAIPPVGFYFRFYRILFILMSSMPLPLCVQAQSIQLLEREKSVSIRGLCPVSDRIIWVSGSTGSVGLSTDSGKNWKWTQVKGYGQTDFRDIEAFSDQEAIIMGVTEPAVMLRTTDAGATWSPVFKDTVRGAFFDAFDFDGPEGMLVGDPENGKVLLLKSHDLGRSWNRADTEIKIPEAGEAFFASSGSNMKMISPSDWVLVSGGTKSRLLQQNDSYHLNLNQGKESTGANSIAVNPVDKNLAFIVGGDFKNDTARGGNSLLLTLRPFTQTEPATPPHGYRSCVIYINDRKMISCGTSGVDYSADGGMNWNLISNKSFHVCRKAKSGNTVFLAGARGAIAILSE